MMSLDFYIQSRGHGPKHDYSWVKVTPLGPKRFEPPLLRAKKVYEFIQDSAFSLFIGRYNGRLFLLINGLDASNERRDFQRRPVRHSLVCVGRENGYNEAVLRGLAAASLQERDKIEQMVDAHISFDSQQVVGFSVAAALREELCQFSAPESRSAEPKAQVWGQKNSETLWHDIAEELKTCKLPQQEGPLVVVSKLKDAQKLRRAGVWRGVSELDSQHSSQGFAYQQKKKESQTPFMGSASSSHDASSARNRMERDGRGWDHQLSHLLDSIGPHLIEQIVERLSNTHEWVTQKDQVVAFDEKINQMKQQVAGNKEDLTYLTNQYHELRAHVQQQAQQIEGQQQLIAQQQQQIEALRKLLEQHAIS